MQRATDYGNLLLSIFLIKKRCNLLPGDVFQIKSVSDIETFPLIEIYSCILYGMPMALIEFSLCMISFFSFYIMFVV